MNTTVKDIARKRSHSHSAKRDFEDIYIAVRQQERRIYTDEQLLRLPQVDALHVYHKEWKIRERSCERLLARLRKKRRPLRILEVGCGNGWLSAKMADIPGTDVIGLDVNHVEIDQACRVFKKRNLEFIYDTFNDSTFENEMFDVIVFAASLQYFPSVVTVLKQAQAILAPRGEIHLMDTHFYDPLDAVDADQRSRDYYASLGYPEMSEHYFHHSISEFWGFKYQVLFNPQNILNRLSRNDPFYWITVRK
ncbi:MAG TPA: class I SAM-dependent methyltransferase [Mucilaginibacter sp.]|nr:class I SAM-dependent methyltransferase [Mucilaginibacter sp.]